MFRSTDIVRLEGGGEEMRADGDGPVEAQGWVSSTSSPSGPIGPVCYLGTLGLGRFLAPDRGCSGCF